ncbi:MAG: TonB-dependent receptor plug domain-containing protein [Marinilabiliaceae bacterium]|nr:TonB-dependent receptor plug domain-containing protein [Marinilabiliaceae bacterium]
MLFVFFIINGNIFSQSALDRVVQLDFTTGSTNKLLKHIEDKSGVIFSYTNKVCTYKKVVLSKSKASVKEYLDQIFVNCFVQYYELNNKIVILPIDIRDLDYNIKGFVKDSITGEVLIGANIYDINASIGSVTNDYGFYSFTTSGGEVFVGCSYIGYNSIRKAIKLTRDTIISFNLAPLPALKEIPIVGQNSYSGIRSSQTSIVDVPVNQLQNVPSFFGEMDLIKMIQLFPGVKTGTEGFSGLYVRGGGHDQNLILLDEVPVYNMEHLFGFFSVFNPDAINSVKLIKGGFPAKYGGRLSSVLDIIMLEGNKDKLNKMVSLGLLSSKLSIDGPLKNDKTTYSLSFRRTFYDLIVEPLQEKNSDNNRYYFFDLNAKVNHRFSNKSRLFISAYWGHDNLNSDYNFKSISKTIINQDYLGDDLRLSDKINAGWGNIIVSTRWNYVYNTKLFSNTTLSFTNFNFFTSQDRDYYVDDTWNTITQSYNSGIKDLMAKIDFDYFPKNSHHIKFGVNYIYHQFFPGIEIVQSDNISGEKNDTTIGGEMIDGAEIHGYIQDDFVLSSLLKVNAGVHFSSYRTGLNNYFSAEPRLSVRFLVTQRFALKSSLSFMSQYVHLLRTANISLPSDLWLPVTDKIKPMSARQVSFEGNYEFLPGFNLSAELYYKKSYNELDYFESQSFFDLSTSWSDKLTSGNTESYGLEMLVQRNIGSWSGWLGYTYSKSISVFPGLNDGNPFWANNDRRHDISMFLSHSFSQNIDANMTWSFSSGKPITLADEKYFAPELPTVPSIGSGFSENFSEKNRYRMPNYHRLDVGVNFKKNKYWGKRVWSIGVMNLYGRQNPFFLYFSDNFNENTGESNRTLNQFSLFPFPFPYIRYTIQF